MSLGAIAVVIGAFLLLKLVSPRQAIEYISELGPVPFFASLAILPAFAAPITPWYLLAGPAFGLKVAIPGCIAAITVNIAVTYVAARWLMRPLIVRLMERTGYTVPVVRPEDRWQVTLLVRITPGPPFFIQSYLLGLAGVPFSIYLLVSVPVAALMGVGVIVFGESLLSGRSGQVVIGVSMIIVAVIAVRLVRRIVNRRAQARLAEAEGQTVAD